MKNLISFLSIIALLSCGNSKQVTKPDYVIGIKEANKKNHIVTDSLHIVTPSIEVYEMVNNKSHEKYDKRESLKNYVIQILKSEMINAEYYDLPIMSEDYLTVNRVTENILYEKYRNPNWIIKAPNDLLINGKKYTLFLSMTGHYGDIGGGVIYFTVINNETKVLERVDRYNFSGSPLDENGMKKIIKKGLYQITAQNQ